MKKDRVLNPGLVAEIAALGHTEYIVVADAGLPIPNGIKVIDLSVAANIPSFLQVLEAINSELVSEEYILAEEMPMKNPALYEKTRKLLEGRGETLIAHEQFKKFVKEAKAVVRTGETSSYANVILVGGVNF